MADQKKRKSTPSSTKTKTKPRTKAKTKKHSKKKKKKTLFGRIIRIQLGILLVAFLAIMGLLYMKYGTAVVAMYKDAKQLVAESTPDTFKASETSLVYDSDKKLMKKIKNEKEVYYLEYEDIPQYAIDAMISIEDKKFYEHNGIDLKAIMRAGVGVIFNKSYGGGSTITQQLSRNVFLTTKYSWERKVEEIFLSLDMEKKYSKDQIMEFYLNNIYFMNGYYGIQAASKGYFGKDVNKLSLSQIATLCAIPNNPNLYNPREKLENTLKRRDRILKNMLDDG